MMQDENRMTTGERMLAPHATRISRAARLMTGSHDATAALLAAVAKGLERLERQPRDEKQAAREVWRLAAQHLVAADCRAPGEFPPPREEDSPAERLAPVVAALPTQLRLALALTHQGRLGLDELAAAMQVDPVVAEGLLASAEERLVTLARARGDWIEAPARPQPARR